MLPISDSSMIWLRSWILTLVCKRTITKMLHAAHCRTEIITAATKVSIYTFIYACELVKLMLARTRRKETRRKMDRFWSMAFCGAKPATSVQTCVWMRTWSQVWRDCLMNSFTELSSSKVSGCQGLRLTISVTPVQICEECPSTGT